MRNENLKSSLNDLCVIVHNDIIIPSSLKLETAWMSIKWLMDKQNMVYPHDGIRFVDKKYSYTLQRGWTSKTLPKWKKLNTNDSMLYNSIYMKRPQKANL